MRNDIIEGLNHRLQFQPDVGDCIGNPVKRLNHFAQYIMNLDQSLSLGHDGWYGPISPQYDGRLGLSKSGVRVMMLDSYIECW
jgi:hypothetical protein